MEHRLRTRRSSIHLQPWRASADIVALRRFLTLSVQLEKARLLVYSTDKPFSGGLLMASCVGNIQMILMIT